MGILSQMLSESLLNEDAAYKKKAIKEIYKVIEKSKMTAHKFSDTAWENVFKLMDVIRSVDTYVAELDYLVARGGYTNMTTKEYKLNIVLTSGEQIHGVLTAHAAGIMKDPWSSYDMTVQLW